MPDINFDLLPGDIAELDAVCTADLLHRSQQELCEFTYASAAWAKVIGDDSDIRITDDFLLL